MKDLAILIPNFNGGEILEETVNSIRQAKVYSTLTRYLQAEIVICDDASTDQSWSLIQKIQREFPTRDLGIAAIRNKTKEGKLASLNKLMTYIKGQFEYVVILNADDWLLPDYFDITLPLLQDYKSDRDQEVGFVYTDSLLMDQDGKYIGECISGKFSKTVVKLGYIPQPALVLARCLESAYPLGDHCATCARHSHYQKMCLELNWTGIHIPKPGFLYRIYDQNKSQNVETLSPGQSQYLVA